MPRILTAAASSASSGLPPTFWPWLVLMASIVCLDVVVRLFKFAALPRNAENTAARSASTGISEPPPQAWKALRRSLSRAACHCAGPRPCRPASTGSPSNRGYTNSSWPAACRATATAHSTATGSAEDSKVACLSGFSDVADSTATITRGLHLSRAAAVVEAAAAVARVPSAASSRHNSLATFWSSLQPPRKLIKTSKAGLQPMPTSKSTSAAPAPTLAASTVASAGLGFSSSDSRMAATICLTLRPGLCGSPRPSRCRCLASRSSMALTENIGARWADNLASISTGATRSMRFRPFSSSAKACSKITLSQSEAAVSLLMLPLMERPLPYSPASDSRAMKTRDCTSPSQKPSSQLRPSSRQSLSQKTRKPLRVSESCNSLALSRSVATR